MFSGIITSLQKPTSIIKNETSIKLTLPKPKGWKIKNGDSVAIDGICSTVEKTDNDSFSIHFMEETLKKTSLTHLPDTHNYNLEQSLTLNTLIGGHLVSGHIDTSGTVLKIKQQDDSTIVIFKIPELFSKYVTYKGSIAINGVSLTVVKCENDKVIVSLIPYTLSHTNLGDLNTGDLVNIEVDLLAKYLAKLTGKE